MTPIEGQPGGPVPTTSNNCKVNPNWHLLVISGQMETQGVQLHPKAVGVMHLLLKRGANAPVSDEEMELLQLLNPQEHPGCILMKDGSWVPVALLDDPFAGMTAEEPEVVVPPQVVEEPEAVVPPLVVEEPKAALPPPVVEKPEAALPPPVVEKPKPVFAPPPKVAKPDSLAALQRAILGGKLFIPFAQRDTDGLTPCTVFTTAQKGVCVCGNRLQASDMRAVRIGDNAYVPVGPACAKEMPNLPYADGNFAQVLDDIQRKKADVSPPSTLEALVAALKKGARLQFSQEQEIEGQKGFFPCTLAVNGKELCNNTGHGRKFKALNYKGHVFPVCPECAENLRLLDPKLDITNTSFAQARGWGDDRFPSGQHNTNHKKDDDVRAGVQINANGVVSLAKKDPKPRGSAAMDDDEKKAAYGRNKARNEAAKAARKAKATKPTTSPNPKGGGKKAQGGNDKKTKGRKN